MLKALVNATIYTGSEKITGKALIINDDIIESLTDNESVPDGAVRIDCKNNFLAPGLIDLQIAGGGGSLFSAKPSAEALKDITGAIVRSGTTGFLIVIPTNTFDVYHKVTKVVRENPHSAVLGLHFEGPYISHARRGAHIREYIRVPEKKEIESLLEDARGVVKMFTIAPEVCSSEVIRILDERGIVVAAGHSIATFREAVQGFNQGIKTTTHLFNAMSQIHHRDPGLPGAVFQTDKVMASIIADGIHVDYNIISIAKKLLGERLFLVSDAVEENLQGNYLHVRHKDRFTLPDGTLSGSRLSMLKAVKNCVEHVGMPVEEALRMASVYPAALMNLKNKGKIETGYKADLILFDRDFEIQQVYLEGEQILM